MCHDLMSVCLIGWNSGFTNTNYTQLTELYSRFKVEGELLRHLLLWLGLLLCFCAFFCWFTVGLLIDLILNLYGVCVCVLFLSNFIWAIRFWDIGIPMQSVLVSRARIEWRSWRICLHQIQGWVSHLSKGNSMCLVWSFLDLLHCCFEKVFGALMHIYNTLLLNSCACLMLQFNVLSKVLTPL